MARKLGVSLAALIVVSMPVSSSLGQGAEYWSAATRAMTEADGETLYNEYESYREFSKSFLSFPGVDWIGVPYQKPEIYEDVLLRQAGLIEYVERRTAQKLGVFVDPLLNAYQHGYGDSSDDSLAAGIATEIGYEGTKLIGTSYRASVTTLSDFVFNPRPAQLTDSLKNQALGIVEGGLKMWIANSIQENVLKDKSIEAYRSAIEKNNPAVKALERATKEQVEKAIRFERSLNKLEVEGSSSSADDQQGSDLRKHKLRLIRELSSAKTETNLQQIAEGLEKGEYGPPSDRATFKEVIHSAREFVVGTQLVIGRAQQVYSLLDTAGVDLDPKISKALNTASLFTNSVSQLASGNFFGAAMGAASLFGPKKPSPEALRHAAIMGALNQISRKLDGVLLNQRKLLQGQARIMRKLDQLQWSVDAGFQSLESSLQESSEIILRAIFSTDERKVGDCRLVGGSVNNILFPEAGESESLFENPNFLGLPVQLRERWSSSTPKKGQKLNYIVKRYGSTLSNCYSALLQIFNGIQSRRGIDEYFKLSRLDNLPNEIDRKEIKFEGDRKPEEDFEKRLKFAKDFREKLFKPQLRYYEQRAVKKLVNMGRNVDHARRLAVMLAFRPPLRLSEGWSEVSIDPNAPWFERSRFSNIDSKYVLKFERYFTDLIYREYINLLSVSTVEYAVNAAIEIHSLLGLFGPHPRAHINESAGDFLKPNIEFEESALRLLLQALQVVEVLRAQQAVVDGSSLVDLLWRDMFSRLSDNWKNPQDLLKNNSLLRKNFGRYFIHRVFTSTKDDSLSTYRWLLTSADQDLIGSAIKERLGDGFSVDVRCREPDADSCSVVQDLKYRTPYTATVSWADTADQNKISTFEITLPGFEIVENRQFSRSQTSLQIQALHDRLRKEIASYQISDEIAKVLNDDIESATDQLRSLYRYTRNLSRGHLSPSKAN